MKFIEIKNRETNQAYYFNLEILKSFEFFSDPHGSLIFGKILFQDNHYPFKVIVSEKTYWGFRSFLSDSTTIFYVEEESDYVPQEREKFSEFIPVN